MQSFRTIEIDYDVHRLIELERSHIRETPNDVLRRLLGVDRPKAVREKQHEKGASARRVDKPAA